MVWIWIGGFISGYLILRTLVTPSHGKKSTTIILIDLERANLMLMSFVLLADIAEGIVGDNSILESSENGIVWRQYAKNSFQRVVKKLTYLVIKWQDWLYLLKYIELNHESLFRYSSCINNVLDFSLQFKMSF